MGATPKPDPEPTEHKRASKVPPTRPSHDLKGPEEMEQALRESEERFRLVSLATNDAVWDWDLAQDRTTWSEGLHTIFGYPHQAGPKEQKWWDERVHPEDRERVVADLYNRLDRGEQFWSAEYRFRRADGSYADVFDRGYVIRDAHRKPTRVVGALTDISDRKRVERQQSALYRIGEQARSAEDLHKLYATIHAILGELMYAKNCYIALHDPVTDRVSFPYFVDEKETAPAPRKFGRGLTEYVLRTGQPLLAVPEMLKELVRKGEVRRIGAPSLDWMGVPLKTGDTTFGALVLQTYEEKPCYGDKEKEILTFVSQQIATAIEQKRSDEALRESQRALSTLMSNLPGLAYRCRNDRDWTMEFVSEGAIELTGYKPSDFIGSRKVSFEQLLHPEDRAPGHREVEAALREGRPFRYVYRIRTASGEEKWIWEQGRLVARPEGEPEVLEGFMIDITDRKRTEKELAESENKFRAVSETTSGGIFIRRGDRFRYVNPAAEQLTGYSREELLAMDHTQIVHPDFRPLLQERSEARLRGEAVPSRYEAKLLSKDGQERWAELTATIIEFEGEPAVLTTTFDITDRKRAEKELAESETKFRAVAETAAAAIYIHDGLKFLFVNRTAESISGYSREELLAKGPFDLVHPEHRQVTQQRGEAKQRGEPVPTRYEFKILTKSGETRWLDFSASVVQFEGRSAVLAMAFDITERKRAEALQSALYRIAEKARSAEALPQLYASIHAILGELMHAKNCYIALYDPATDLVSFPYFVDEKDPPFPPHKFGRGLTEYILRTGQPLLATPEKLDELAQQGEVRRMGAASLDWMGVPLKRGGQTFGALVLQSYESNIQYGEKEKEILTFVSQQIAAAIEGKRSEEAIRESESKFRAVAEGATVAIGIVDGSRLAYVNPTFETLTGYSWAELRTMDAWTVVRPDHRAMMHERMRSRLQGQSADNRYEFAIITKSGEERWLDFSAGVIEFEGQVAVLGTAADITERKRAERLQSALYRISEQATAAEDLPQLFASLHAIVGELMYARNFYIALYDAAAEILSFPYFVDEEDVTPAPKKLGKGLTEYVLRTGEPLLASPEVFDELVRRGEAENVGAPSVDWLGVPLKSGNATFGVLVVQSYTENVRFNEKQKDILTFVSQHVATAIDRKRAQDAVRASEERYRRVVEVSPEAIYINSKGRFVYANPAAMQLFRARSSEDLIGTLVMDRIHPDYKEMVQKRIQETSLGGRLPLMEEKFIRLDGTEVDVEVVATSLVYQDEPAGLVVLREITERKRAEAALRDSEARYRKQVQGAVYGIYRSTVDDRFLEVNPALVSMLGCNSEQELLALKLSRDVYLDPEERGRIIQKYGRNERVENVETHWKKKDGTPIEVRLSGRAVLNQKGEAETFEMIAEDITERRSLEQQLRQSQKMEAVGRLAGGVAHDFNNLLTVIKGYSELMLEQTAPGGPLRAEAEEVKKAADRAANLTRQLLAFSRQQVLAPRILSLNSVVGNMEQMLPRLLGEDIELSTALDEKVGQVKADPGQIEQVIMNLAVNSRDAMPRGGKLTIETANATLDESYMREHGGVKPGRYVMLAVSDTGAGMDEETRSRIFEPFFTTKEMGKGTGLGLSTVYGIVKQSDGYIWVYSEAGQGTTFKVYLPRVDESAEESQKMAALDTGDRGTETILLVEDEDGVRALVKQVLSRQGYSVIETRHGQEALEECGRHTGPIPLLLTDVVLPQMSGRELAEHLKVLRPDIKVLYMSGYTDDAILRHGVIDQETAFLQKPFTTSALARKVREVLDQGA